MQEVHIGIEIGGTKLQIFTGDKSSQILKKYRFDINPKEGRAGIMKHISDTVKEIKSEYQPIGTAVGFGGPVDWKTGQINNSYQVDGWSSFNIGEWLEGITECPVFIENDANTAALAEAIFGSGKSYNPVFYVTMGSGVGGGLVIEGKIYHGRSPGEVEIGHALISRHGDTVQSSCSGWAVDQKIRKAKAKDPNGLLSKLTKNIEKGEARFLSEAIKSGDQAAVEILENTAEDFAFALSHVIHLIHPEIIVIGGGLSLVGEPLRAAIEKAVTPLIFKSFNPIPEIRLSTLKEDVVPIGALELSRQRINHKTVKQLTNE